MKFGELDIEQVSEGHFVVSNRGSIERYRPAGNDTAETVAALGSSYFQLVGIDPLLIRTPYTTILVDAGLGLALDEKTRDQRISNLITNLEVLEVDPASITHVILSHLHEDHVRGLVYNDAAMASRPTLPNAQILVQRLEWEYALQRYDNPDTTEGLGYSLDDLFKLVADGRFRFIEEEHLMLFPGIDLIRTGGHTPGHQIVRLWSGNSAGYFLGDLVGTSELLNRYTSKSMDTDSMTARRQKNFWLKRAWEENATLFFYHNPHKKTARLIRNQLRLFDVEEVKT